MILTRQAAEDLAAGEGGMHEERDVGVRDELAEHARDEEEVVVVDDDHVALLVLGGDALGKGLVRVQVRLPRVVVPRDLALRRHVLPDEVVQQRPEHCGGLGKGGIVKSTSIVS